MLIVRMLSITNDMCVLIHYNSLLHSLPSINTDHSGMQFSYVNEMLLLILENLLLMNKASKNCIQMRLLKPASTSPFFKTQKVCVGKYGFYLWLGNLV